MIWIYRHFHHKDLQIENSLWFVCNFDRTNRNDYLNFYEVGQLMGGN